MTNAEEGATKGRRERLVCLADGGVVGEGVFKLALEMEERGLTVVGLDGGHVNVWPRSLLTEDLTRRLQAHGRELWAYYTEHCTRVDLSAPLARAS